VSDTPDYHAYLDALRDSGATNMFGATPYLEKEFSLTSDEACGILTDWMENFGHATKECQMTDIKQHELERISTMTDRELHTRYGKMGVREKIKAFHEALCDTNRCEQLRQTIEKDHGFCYVVANDESLSESAIEAPSGESWYVRKHNTMYGFQKHDDYNIKVLRWECIGVREQSKKEMWTAHDVHDDYANGYYPTDQGRLFWDKKIVEGYTQFDPKFSTDAPDRRMRADPDSYLESPSTNYALTA
jgi:hypothetical protein